MLYRSLIQAQIIILIFLFAGCEKPVPVKESKKINSEFVMLYPYPIIYDEIGIKEVGETLDSCGLGYIDKETKDRFIHLLDDNGYYCPESVAALQQLVETTEGPNIFIYLDKITWANQYGIFKRIKHQALRDGRFNESNFWTDVEPVVKHCGKEVFFWTYMMGENPDDDIHVYQNYENIHIIGFGANSETSCAVMTARFADGSVSWELKYEDNDTLFDLTTYTLPFARTKREKLVPSAN